MSPDDLEIDGPPPTLLPEQDYDAVVKKYEMHKAYGRSQVLFTFSIVELGPHKDVELPGYANLGRNGKPRPQSKLLNWYRRAGGLVDKRNRLRLSVFREALLRVRVANVAPDRQRKDIDQNSRRSVVVDILGVSARLGGEKK